MDNVTPHEVGILKSVIDVSCEVLDQAVLVYDRSDTLVFASKQILKYYALDPDDLMPGTHMRQFFGAVFDYTQRYYKADAASQARKSREDWVAEKIAQQWNERFETVERYANDRWMKVGGRRMADGLGVTILQDVTESTKLEARWRSEIEHMASTEAVLDQMPYPLIVKDKNMAYVGVNKAFCELRNLKPEQVLGRTAWDINDSALAATFEASDVKVLETGESYEAIEVVEKADGSTVRCARRDFRVGKPGQYFLVSMLGDMTEAEPAGRDDLLVEAATTGREEKKVLNEDRQTTAYHAEETNGSGGNRILLVSSHAVFSGTCIDLLKRYGFDACAVTGLQEEEAFLCEAERLKLLPDLVLADKHLSADCVHAADRHDIPTLAVDPARPVHFLIGDVLANLPSRREEIEIDVGGGGSTFFAPPGLPAFEGPDDLPTYRYSDIEVLVVEDNPINQEVFSSVLDSLGILYRVAENAEKAFALNEELHPKLILMDVTLPDMDGYDAARQLKAHANGYDIAPVVGVLPRESAADETRCIEAGMKGCIVKPISTESIELVYSRYVKSKAGIKHKERGH